jgi:hypothetical protein
MISSNLPQIKLPHAMNWYVHQMDAATSVMMLKSIKIWDAVYQQVDWAVSDHLWRLTDENI